MSYSYADAGFSSLFQADDFFRTDERKLTNLSISYERDTWAAYLFCNNCADEVYITSAVNTVPAPCGLQSAANGWRAVQVRLRVGRIGIGQGLSAEEEQKSRRRS